MLFAGLLVAAAAADEATLSTALVADARAELPNDVKDPASEEAVAEPVAAAAEPVQAATVGRLVTPTGEQICWAKVIIAVRGLLALASFEPQVEEMDILC